MIFIVKLVSLMLAISSISQFVTGTASPTHMKRDDPKLYDGYPKCKHIKAEYGSTWLPAAFCALVDKTKGKFIQDKVIEVLDNGDIEKPEKLKVNLYDYDLKLHSFTYQYEHIGYGDSAGKTWWPGPIDKAVIEQADGWWLTGETPMVDPESFVGFKTDDVFNQDPSIGLWKLTGKRAQVQVKDDDFDKNKGWDWLSKNSDHSPIVISTKKDSTKLGKHQCYTVMTTKIEDDAKRIHLFDPNETEEKWFLYDEVYGDLEKIGHLADFPSI